MQIIEKRENGTIRVSTLNLEPDMAQQQFKDECDINEIIAKAERTGQITHLNSNPGRYAELGEAKDLLDAKLRVIRAETAFMALPANVRARFGHDPVQMLEFLKDPKNDEEGIKLGIIKPKEKPFSTTKPIDPPKVDPK